MKLGVGGCRGKHPCYLPNTVKKTKFLFVGQVRNTKKGMEYFLPTGKVMITVIKKIMTGFFSIPNSLRRLSETSWITGRWTEITILFFIFFASPSPPTRGSIICTLSPGTLPTHLQICMQRKLDILHGRT